MMFSRKKNQDNRPNLDLAHEQWTRSDFEQLKRITKDDYGFLVAVLYVTKSIVLNPHVNTNPSKATYDFSCVPTNNHLGWYVQLSILDEHHSNIGVSEERLEDPTFDPERHVGWMDLSAASIHKKMERNLRDKENFTKVRGQTSLPELHIVLLNRYQDLGQELYESCRHTKQESSVMDIRLACDWRKPIQESWEAFKSNDNLSSLWVPLVEVECLAPDISFLNEYSKFCGFQYNTSKKSKIDREEFLLEIQEKYENGERR